LSELLPLRADRPDTMAVAVGIMGEGVECIPSAVVLGWLSLVFNDSTGQSGVLIPTEDDLFAPVLASLSARDLSPPRARR
jgi:F420-0:gamma-glutamyl ligase